MKHIISAEEVKGENAPYRIILYDDEKDELKMIYRYMKYE